jgi:hypothetical protein
MLDVSAFVSWVFDRAVMAQSSPNPGTMRLKTAEIGLTRPRMGAPPQYLSCELVSTLTFFENRAGVLWQKSGRRLVAVVGNRQSGVS